MKVTRLFNEENETWTDKANEYEIELEAFLIQWFTKGKSEGLALRDLEYIAHNLSSMVAAETILNRSMDEVREKHPRIPFSGRE